jgi:DNA polymerase III delta prime subunit
MARVTKSRPKGPSLEDRFVFHGDALAPGDRAALKSALFEVEDRATGATRSLKLWRKTDTSVDDDLRGLWLHEMRQVQRVMSYAGAREVIVDVLEFVEDGEFFGVLLERAGQPLSAKRRKVNRYHWMQTLDTARSRALLWKNMRRVAIGLGIVHAQGLVHGKLSADVVMTEGLEEPDFQLGGFEWSLWVGADTADKAHAKVSTASAAQRSETYSFAEDWRAFGTMVADGLGLKIKPSGEIAAASAAEALMVLNGAELALLMRLTAPSRYDLVDAASVTRSIDEIVSSIAQATSVQQGTFILGFAANAALGEAVYEASNGEIPIDEFRAQLDWLQADLDCGAKLLVPRPFDPAQDNLRIITEAMLYRVRPFRDEGSPVWNIGVCFDAKPRPDAIRLRTDLDHLIEQPIAVGGLPREVQDLRARLGPAVIDWSLFAGAGAEPAQPTRVDAIRQALLLVQVTEAVVKAFEYYPIEVLDRSLSGGRRFVIVRAEPDNDRDRIARRTGLGDSATALKRLFEEDRRDADSAWSISQSAALGGSRIDDITATFVDLRDHRGRHGYLFEIDDDLPPDGPYFLKAARDTGTEQVISRRLRNIKALDTRVDLAEMLDDPWRVRRSSRESISEEAQADKAFKSLDEPKQRALLGLWSTAPSYFVVGPPGVGKTRLATETVRRRFEQNRATRLLVSAQGHDALDNLQTKIKEALDTPDLKDVIVVRSTTPDRRATSDEEVHLTGLGYLDQLSSSPLFDAAPKGLRDRLANLKSAAQTLKNGKDGGTRDIRAGLRAVSSLVVDGANVLITTANSPDVEDLVEAREQFDWTIIEEAAKATGPELVGPLMLSGRRLFIGDHHQLPPFGADRLGKILVDHSLLTATLDLAQQFVGPLMREGELDELERVARDPARLVEIGNIALRLLEPFRSFVEEDERRARTNSAHRPISSTLSQQRRMDPAICRIISEAFYDKGLETHESRRIAAETEPPPFVHRANMPPSPVVVVNFDHVSVSGRSQAMERGNPRWNNPSEIQAVINVLRHVRARQGAATPSLAVLSPYLAQVEMLDRRIANLRATDLAHLGAFKPVRPGHGFVGTVDSFQGSEADLVIVSMVRNNPQTGGGALGFLRDRRRINVALSRAKSQLVLVGSLAFLREAVRGVNPDAETHDLSFLTRIVDTIEALTTEKRGDMPLAAIIPPAQLQVRP